MSQEDILAGVMLMVLVGYIGPMAVLMWGQEPVSVTMSKIARQLREAEKKAREK